MTTTVEAPALDVSQCDKEPIHILGHIQPHGWLCACAEGGRTITYASENAARICRSGRDTILGSDLADILGDAAAADIGRNAKATGGVTGLPGRLFGIKLKFSDDKWDATVHTYAGMTVYEFEPSGEADVVSPLDLVRGVLHRLQQAKSLRELCDGTAQMVRELTGFDRVLIYRFLDDGAGQVVAEARTAELESLLNLRYPASDIPRQARELYKRSWIRLIADVDATQCAVRSASALASQPLDLSYSALRSVSPVHIQYLRNMKVGASMSISIIVAGELWGLIACHHVTARHVRANVRAACELLGQVFSLQIQTVEGIEAYVTMRAARALLDRIVAEFPLGDDLIENLAQRLEPLSAFINSEGAGIWIDGIWRSIGLSPPMTEIAPLAAFASSRRPGEVYWTQALGDVYERANRWPESVCGLMAIPLSRASGDVLFFFRKEVGQTIDWGGNPEKPAQKSAGDATLSPRSSFAAWRETVKGQSLPWTSRERLIADTLRIYLLDIIVRLSDVIMDERHKMRQSASLLTSELNTRVKGTLELIRSLVAQGHKETSIARYVRALEGRIGSISLAHEAISANNGTRVDQLVRTSLGALSQPLEQVDLSGPDVELESKAFAALAMVVHELVTNASKFGALSTPHGQVLVEWSKGPGGDLTLVWEERGSPFETLSGTEGLGLNIIRNNIPHALDGEADVQFSRNGIAARFVIPARPGGRCAVPSHAGGFHLPAQSSERLLDGLSILVLDDQLLSATDLKNGLVRLGAATATIAGTVKKALEAIAVNPPDAAVLDFDLDGETSAAVADELDRLGIAFVLLATELERQVVPNRFNDAVIVSKPASAEIVAHQIRGALMPGLIRAILTDLV